MMEDKHAVEYNFLGKSGVKVSNICLGTMTFGTGERSQYRYPTQADKSTSHEILTRFSAMGGNFIDTADFYSYGLSEEIVGDWLKKQDRSKFVIATKIFVNMDRSKENVNKVGLSRRHIMEGCDESLKRLQIETIDLLQAFLWDDAVSLEETLRAFDDLIRCGKIRYYGYCNVSGWQLQKIVDTAKALNITMPTSLQQQYSLLSRQSEWEAFMVCQNEGLAILPWSPLKGGLLTGKFKRDEPPPSTDSRIGFIHHAEHLASQTAPAWSLANSSEDYWSLMAVMDDIAKAKGKSIAQVAIRWLLQKQNVASVIIGVTSVKQLEDNMGAAWDWKLSTEEMRKLDEAGPRSREYPYEMIYRSSDRHNTFNRSNVV